MLAAIADWGVVSWLLAGLLLLLVVLVLILFKFLNLWIQAVMTRTKVTLPQLIGMSLRKVNPTVIVRGMISANQAGIPLETRQLEAHFLAGGDVSRVVNSLNAAGRTQQRRHFP